MARSKRIFVGAGTYDAALGEVFPLVLRGSLTVQGTGADRTFVRGSGEVDHQTEGGVFNGTYFVTAVVGDHDGDVVLSNLALRPGKLTPEKTHVGVYCDRGRATVRTHLEELKIGPDDLYLHMAHAFGLKVNTIGMAAWCKGPLPGVV